MQQLMESLDTGDLDIVDAPCPQVRRGSLLIQTTRTLVSVGTEGMLLDFGRANLLQKARKQPDKVKEVLQKVKTDGLSATINAVKSKLKQPIPLGYCNVGIVVAVGEGVTGFRVGDRVASNGSHADMVCVPANLCACIPENVSDEAAAFTVIGSIALQGIRLANPTLGECVVVMGLGLVGLMTVQLLLAQGCRVLGFDFDAKKLALAESFGAQVYNLNDVDDPVACGLTFSRGKGIDAVLITASTKSNDPVSNAAKMSRQRGRIVLVGVTGLQLSRADFYKKELTFQVSCSYGPGRYDTAYEQKGQDYPIGFVRWTEQRNFEAVLDIMSAKRINTDVLITHQFDFQEAKSAYDLIHSPEFKVGIILSYKTDAIVRVRSFVTVHPVTDAHKASLAKIGFIGAGNFASRTLIPAFVKTGAQLTTVVSQQGINAVTCAKKYSIAHASSAVGDVVGNEAINTVVITTRHDTHAALCIAALGAGQNVFVEKPLCLTQTALDEIKTVYQTARSPTNAPRLMLGFNRRFAPITQKMKSLLKGIANPMVLVMTVNAGFIPADHWTQDLKVGGGRLLGEACHFVDLLQFLVGESIVDSAVYALNNVSISSDKITIQLQFVDGSMGTIHYLANGNKRVPKERLEIFASGKVLQMDNFRSLKGYGFKGFKKMTVRGLDKGHNACAKAFVDAINQGAPTPIPSTEIFEVMQVCLNLNSALAK